MVDTKKEQERDELHRAIWAIADELRGAVDVLLDRTDWIEMKGETYARIV